MLYALQIKRNERKRKKEKTKKIFSFIFDLFMENNRTKQIESH